MKDKIILIGGGGHCKSVIDVIEKESKFEIAGIIDVKEKIGATVLNYPIIGCDDDIEKLSNTYSNFIITFGQGKTNTFREKTFKKLKSLNLNLPIIQSPFSHLSKHALVGEGTVIMHGTIINANSIIGINCILNSQCLIEHDVIVGNHCHISTKATLNGSVKVGNSVFAGSSSVVADGVTICDNVTIGAGSAVIRDISVAGIYAGCPSKRIS